MSSLIEFANTTPIQNLVNYIKKCNDELKKDNKKLKQDNDKYFIENYIFKEDNKLLKFSIDPVSPTKSYSPSLSCVILNGFCVCLVG